jgi:hypothetical protein
MLRKVSLAIVVILGLASIAAAADKPNYSGTWKLNVGKSEYGMIPPPTSRIDVIEQKGDDFKITVDSEVASGKEHFVLNFTADGKDVTVPDDSPNAHLGAFTLKKIKAEWNGGALVLTEIGVIQDLDVTAKNTYNLSADGKTLTVNSHITLPMGEIDVAIVSDKQ